MKIFYLLLILIETCYSKQIFEANVGDTIKLHCPGNDDDHMFKFWQTPHEILGPGKNFNREKYKYEVLTGTLFIREISPNEHGIYTCYSKNILNGVFKDESLELLVEENWETSYENDYMTNVFRGIIIVSVSIILACILCILYHLQNKTIPLIGGDSPDGQEDERFLPDAMEMTAHLDTEFPKEFTTTAQIN